MLLVICIISLSFINYNSVQSTSKFSFLNQNNIDNAVLGETFNNYYEIYVSNQGNDSHDGSKMYPLKTIQKSFSRLSKPDIHKYRGVVIFLYGGTYYLDSVINISNLNLNKLSIPIVVQPYNNEQVIISGNKLLNTAAFSKLNKKVPKWGLVPKSVRNGVYCINLINQRIFDLGRFYETSFGQANSNTMELFSNNTPAVLARWPDKEEISETQNSSEHIRSLDNFVQINEITDNKTFTIKESRINTWINKKEIRAHGYFYYLWADFTVDITSILSKRVVKLKNVPQYGMRLGTPLYFENILEELTQKEEYYIDETTGFLYYYPSGSIKSKKLEVSILPTILEITNSSNITFSNIIFDGCRNDGIVIKDSNSINFSNCIIRNTGGIGINIIGTKNSIENCSIYNCGETGVVLNGGDRATLKNGENIVSNCDIHDFGRVVFTYTPGVKLFGVGNIVTNNEIHHSRHSAILYKGNNHLIEYNNIYNVCRLTLDAGAIYSGRDWGGRGNIIRYNYIHDIKSVFKDIYLGKGTVNGVYLDDCLSGNTVYGNIFYKVTGIAVLLGGGRDNVIKNNIIVKSGTALLGDNRGLVYISNKKNDSWNMLEKITTNGINYKSGVWAKQYPDLALIPDNWNEIISNNKKWLYPEGNIFSYNIGYNNSRWMTEEVFTGSGVFNKFKAISNNYNNINPIFEDPDNNNMTLKMESILLRLPGFTNIPFEKIGRH